MADLNATDFTDFFEALWAKPPFAWQQDLAERVLEQDAWPEAIELPAASGKTACLDIAVFALAAQAERMASNEAITAPRRIFFVVDRRVIVDQAYERACRMRSSLRDAKGGILKEVADRLRQIARGGTTGFKDDLPLGAYSLRGGMYRSEAWARDPLQPMIVASTVDQVGSRLLFRGYGRSSSTWPIYAGLAANDSLILLDEAHCAQPFMQTLQAVERFRAWGHEPLKRSFYPVVMSATPPPNLSDVFEDKSCEGRDPLHPLGKRQLANKPATLKKVSKATGKRATAELAKAMSEQAVKLIDGGRRAIVVFANRVATARETCRLLKGRDDVEAVLLTGRMRPVDKEAVVRRLEDLDLHSDRSAERELEKPVIVVATQTLEVGADLDFDGLVTECASLDALRQRFGRLNRMGRDIKACAVILIRADQAKLKRNDEGDPVYGKALAKTWDWLDDVKDKNGEVDFGIAHLPQGDGVGFNAPSLDAPVMLPAHVDCWGQTEPVPQPSPDVALFLHGPRETAPDVHMCWRAGLDLTNRRDDALDLLRLCPPSSSETIPVPIGVFKRWLAGEDESDESADVEGVKSGTDADRERETFPGERNVIRWRGGGTKVEDITSNPSAIGPGDVIVIPTTHPGTFEQIGDLPTVATYDSLDVGDQAYRLARAKPILRLQEELVKVWPDTVTARDAALELLEDLERKYEEDPDEIGVALYRLIAGLAGQSESLSEDWAWLPKTAREILKECAWPSMASRGFNIVGGRSLVIAGRRRVLELERDQDADLFSDEDDSAASGFSHRNGYPVRLGNHLRGVEGFARRYALGCGLPDELAEAVARAGLLHDLGKADPRFQSMLIGGRLWNGSEYLAKSARYPKTQAAREAARKAAGYPGGRPHPLLSVRLAESAPELLPESDDLCDLVLHLIASHHGHCRPFAPVVSDESPRDVDYDLEGNHMRWSGPINLERLDSGVADRYWRLVRRYGWWGLAWLEAMLRLADWRRSEWEESNDDGE